MSSLRRSVAATSGRAFLSYVQPSLRAMANSSLLTSRIDPLVPFAVSNTTWTEDHLIVALLYEQPSPFLIPETLRRELYQMAECEEAREAFDLYSLLKEANLNNLEAAVYFLVGGTDNGGPGHVTTTSTRTATITGSSPPSVNTPARSALSRESSSHPLLTALPTDSIVSIPQPTEVSRPATRDGQPTSSNAAGQGATVTSRPPATSPQSNAGLDLSPGSTVGDSAGAKTLTTLTIDATAIKTVSIGDPDGPSPSEAGGLTVTAAAGRGPEPGVVAAALLFATGVVYRAFL